MLKLSPIKFKNLIKLDSKLINFLEIFILDYKVYFIIIKELNFVLQKVF